MYEKVPLPLTVINDVNASEPSTVTYDCILNDREMY